VIALLPPFVGLVLLPIAGAALDAIADTRRAGVRRSLSAVAHVFAAGCATLLAVVAGHRTGHAGWDYSATVLVMLAGAAWIEAVFLSGIRVHHRRTERQRTGGRLSGSEDAVRAEGIDFPGRPGALSEEGEALLLRVLALESLPVQSIMTPRERVTTADATASPAEAVERMRASGHGRLPVTVDGSLDRILGVVHAKDLVPLVIDGGNAAPLRRQVRRCLHVPQDQPVARLLADFRRNRVHFGIVTDPLGRTLGLVTIGDVFAHLAGTRAERGTDAGDPGVSQAPEASGGFRA
jgi:CBS domain containing-hemolysin-like protein